MGLTLIYLPRGPVGDLEDKEAMMLFSSSLKKWAKKRGAVCVIADPFVINNRLQNIIQKYFDRDFFETINHMSGCGFKYKGRTTSMEDTYQPRINLSVRLFDDNYEKLSYRDIVKKASSKTRPKMKGYQEKRGITFERYIGESIDFERFSKILMHTEQRQNINLRNAEYFGRFTKAYKDEIVSYFAVLDIDKYKQFICEKIDKGNNVEANKKKLMEADAISLEHGEKIDVAAGFAHLPYVADDKVNIGEYLYAGSNLEIFPEINAPIGIVGKFLEEAANKGFQYFNLGGVDSDKDSRLYRYKEQFGTDEWEFVGEFVLVVNLPMYFIYDKLLPFAKRIMRNKIIKKLMK